MMMRCGVQEEVTYSKINDSVYVLYEPEPPVKPELDILLFHGMQTFSSGESKAFSTSWISQTEKGEVLWPQIWLAENFPTARVTSICYDSEAIRSATCGRQDLDSLGELLSSDITYTEDLGQDRPMVLVGHSLGGLVIKQLILHILEMTTVSSSDHWKYQKSQSFLSNVKGIFYFGTPHHGTDFTDVSRILSVHRQGPLLDVLKVLSTAASRINSEFMRWRRESKVRAFSICEGRPTQILRTNVYRLIVTEASANCDTDDFMVLRDRNHCDLVKPKSRKDSGFQQLTQFISEVTNVVMQHKEEVSPAIRLKTSFKLAKAYSLKRMKSVKGFLRWFRVPWSMNGKFK